jgi:acetoin utilization deacetylase AcuC-like enzyme
MSLQGIIGVAYHDDFLLHSPHGSSCIETPARLEAIVASLRASGLWDRLAPIAFTAATLRQLTSVHERQYVELVQQQCRQGLPRLSTGDTDICPASFDVAALAAGACIAATDQVMGGRLRSALCLVRPPGHHATASRGMGFCIFNNAALAAQEARRVHRARRVLILDWDLHHGNGTQEIFYEDSGVFYCSLHQDGEYPMPEEQSGYRHEAGSGKGQGANLNIPLAPGAGDKKALEAINELLVPAMREYKPELVVISCGVDCCKGDPLGKLELSNEGIAEMTRIARRIAEDYAGGRVVSVLEGGYNLSNIGPAMCEHVKALMPSSHQ